MIFRKFRLPSSYGTVLNAHTQHESVWLVTWKAANRDKPVSASDEVLDALIAFGWIDGRRMKLDEERTMQLIAPRQEQAWAKTYIQRAERLESEGRMQESGRAAIQDQAKASGRYDSMAEVDDLIEPEALMSALIRRQSDHLYGTVRPHLIEETYCDGLPKPSGIPPKKSGSPTLEHCIRGEKVPNYCEPHRSADLRRYQNQVEGVPAKSLGTDSKRTPSNTHPTGISLMDIVFLPNPIHNLKVGGWRRFRMSIETHVMQCSLYWLRSIAFQYSRLDDKEQFYLLLFERPPKHRSVIPKFHY